MSSIYRSIWNETTGTFAAVAEIAPSAGKKSSPVATAMADGERFVLKALAISLMMAFGANVLASPVGGVVAEGGASISSAAGNTTITQSSQNVAINWQSFNIGQGEAVRFVQPNSNSVALNRVLGPDPSSILGTLSANGKVFLVNPNGILFGKGAQINVGGLVASTLNISDSDFMAGRYQFAGGSGAAVLNQGSINADGGYVALLGANVGNDGIIVARLGTVALAAGQAITLDVAGDGLLNVTVNQGAVNALAQNGGLIQADGGQVLLTARAAGSLLQSAVNNTGVIQAQTIENRNGTIRLLGDMQIGTANVGGTLDASAPNGGNGGFIETSAAHVKVQDKFRITTAAPRGRTGTWLIDPLDYTVGSAPGDNITGAALSAALVDTDVTITTVAGPGPGNGDIIVNEAVTWNGSLGISLVPTTLTLNALRDVNINAAITPTKGNLVVCCGRDINVKEAITTVTGSVLLSAGQDVNIVRSLLNPLTTITTTNGNIKICAARNVNLGNTFNGAALMTLTTGSVVAGEDLANLGVARGMTLSAGTAGTGPGLAGGTVVIGAGTIITVTGPAGISPINIYYNPPTYLAPIDYSGFFATGNGAPYAQFMLVFPAGADKPFDGSTVASFTSLKGAPPGVFLGGAGAANFDTAAAGAGKTVSFTGFTLGGVNAANYAFATSCCGTISGRTTASISAALPLVPPVPPAALLIAAASFAADETLGLAGFTPGLAPGLAPGATPAIAPGLMQLVELAGLPPQLLSIAPVQVPVVVPPPPPVAEEPPPIYVPPVRPRKQDRN